VYVTPAQVRCVAWPGGARVEAIAAQSARTFSRPPHGGGGGGALPPSPPFEAVPTFVA